MVWVHQVWSACRKHPPPTPLTSHLRQSLLASESFSWFHPTRAYQTPATYTVPCGGTQAALQNLPMLLRKQTPSQLWHKVKGVIDARNRKSANSWLESGIRADIRARHPRTVQISQLGMGRKDILGKGNNHQGPEAGLVNFWLSMVYSHMASPVKYSICITFSLLL